MYVFCSVFVSALAALGVALAVLEFVRAYRARRAEYICVCFREELLFGDCEPDMLIICRTDAEQDEIIKRVCNGESRTVYIKKC